MKNWIAPGEVVTLTAPGGGVVGGTGVLVGALFVIPSVTAAAGAKFTGHVVGLVSHAKVSTEVWTEGQRLYWNAGLSQVTSVATAGMFIGVAAEAAANPSATGKVLLAAAPGEFGEGQQAAVTSLSASVGTGDDTVADVGAAFNQTTLNNNFRDLTDKVNTILTRLRDAGIIAP